MARFEEGEELKMEIKKFKKIQKVFFSCLVAVAGSLCSFASFAKGYIDDSHKLNVTQVRKTNFAFKDFVLMPTTQTGYFEISHRKLSSLDFFHENIYLVWNFVPVGLGISLQKSDATQTFAEWSLQPAMNDPLLVSSRFNGFNRKIWSKYFGHEIQLQYDYHYYTNPKPSVWDLSVKNSIFALVNSQFTLGIYCQPQKTYKGLFSSDVGKHLFNSQESLSIGSWTELRLTDKINFKLDGVVKFFESRPSVYAGNYSVMSSLGAVF